MAELKVPIQVNLPDDWVEQIIDRLKNDPDADWVTVIRCKDCKYYIDNRCYKIKALDDLRGSNDYCSRAERREE